MERLTKRNTDGKATIDFNTLGRPFGSDTVYDVVDLLDTACVYLCAYEDTGLAPTEIDRLTRDNNTLRNELCLKCGMYKTAHEGSCDGCRWKPCGVEEIEKCARFFIDDGGQCSAPSCKDEDGRGYKICVTCGGDKTKCCLLGQSI